MLLTPLWTWLRNLDKPRRVKLDAETVERLQNMRLEPCETLEEMYEDLLFEAMQNNGYSKSPVAFKILQDYAFGKITKQEALKKLDRVDYVLWGVV